MLFRTIAGTGDLLSKHASSSSRVTSSIIFRLSFGLHSITLTKQKLGSGSDDSGCVRRIKVCSTPGIFLYCL